jgi:hypothetical protein
LTALYSACVCVCGAERDVMFVRVWCGVGVLGASLDLV